MSAGLEVINDNGIYQIADGYNNHLFSKKQTFQVPPNATTTFNMTAEGHEFGLFVFHSPNTYTYCYYSLSGSTWSATALVKNTTSVVQEMTIYFFDQGAEMASAGFGLEVYDELGKLQFSAAYPPLRILDAPTAGRKMGFLMGMWGSHCDTRQNNTIWADGIRVDGASMSKSDIAGGTVTTGGNSDFHYTAASTIFYVDLTGM